MSDLFPTVHRLGDTLDDFCVKCKRLTNHSIVSLVDSLPVKVRCQSCYSDHDFLREQAPPPKPRKVVAPAKAAAPALAALEDADVDIDADVEEEALDLIEGLESPDKPGED